MKLKNIILSVMFLAAGLPAAAQEQEQGRIEYEFQKHFYLGVQGGIQNAFNFYEFGKSISPNAQINFGWQFSKIFGVRLAVNAWQSKDGFKTISTGQVDYWKFNYVAPAVDLSINLTNFFGYNPKRLCNVDLLAGIGANIAFNNKEANDFESAYQAAYGLPALRSVWDGTQVSFLTRFGADVYFRLADHWQLGLEVMANVVSDKYNSKKGSGSDFYMNSLISARYIFGESYKENYIAPAAPVEKIVEKVVEKIVEVEVPVYEPMERQVFFKIGSEQMSLFEKQKIKDVAEYMKKNTEAKATIAGYSDNVSGSAKRNQELSELRAKAIVDALVKLGIEESRIEWSGKGSSVQIFDDPDLNRVGIIIAK